MIGIPFERTRRIIIKSSGEIAGPPSSCVRRERGEPADDIFN
jgi:hypothetical protein